MTTENNGFRNGSQEYRPVPTPSNVFESKVVAPEDVLKAPVTPSAPETVKESTKFVFLYAIKDLDVPGIGKLEKGYNKVSDKDADKWLEYKSVRRANRDEVATYFIK